MQLSRDQVTTLQRLGTLLAEHERIVSAGGYSVCDGADCWVGLRRGSCTVEPPGAVSRRALGRAAVRTRGESRTPAPDAFHLFGTADPGGAADDSEHIGASDVRGYLDDRRGTRSSQGGTAGMSMGRGGLGVASGRMLSGTVSVVHAAGAGMMLLPYLAPTTLRRAGVHSLCRCVRGWSS